ncbi:hypothetical protein BDW22DRAFT_677466 [Trametopsis cervina]|nr:hypothetical protein BDW22DRAFT_677466 [Trametopsis cervina]
MVGHTGNFCDVYYCTKSFIKTLKSGIYKDKLAGYASGFTARKNELHLLLTSQSALKVADVQTDVPRVLALLETKSAKENKADGLVQAAGGLKVVLKSDKTMDDLAQNLGERIDASTCRMARGDLDEALKANFDVFIMKVDYLSQQINDAVDTSTRTILLKVRHPC